MKRFLHLADLHLGAVNNKLSPSAKKIVRGEQLALVRELFSYASLQNIDFIIIAGDLFHSKAVSQTLLSSFFKEVTTFGKPIIYISGNHDEEASFTPPQNFFVLSKLQSIAIDDVTITGQSSSDNLNLIRLDPTKKNIVMLHGDINARSELDLKRLRGDEVDYLALGHLHSYDARPFGRGMLAYPGCLFGSGFDECGEKGFIQGEISDKVSIKFIPFAKRKFHIVNVDISGLMSTSEIKSAILKAIKDIKSEDYVRVVLTGYYEEDCEKSLSLLSEQFSQSQFYFEIVDASKIKLDYEKLKAEKLSFKSELLTLIGQSELSEQDKTKISQIAIEALRGDDLSL